MGGRKHSVKRRRFLQAGAATALGAPVFAAPAIAQSAPEIKWRMTSSFSKSARDDLRHGADPVPLHRRGHRQQIPDPSPRRRRAHAPAGKRSTPSPAGLIECAHTPLFFYAGKDATLGFGSGLPFGLNARQQLAWWMFGGGAEIVNASLKKLNAHGIPAGSTGAQMGAWFKKEINSIDDLKGVQVPRRRAGRADPGPRRRAAAQPRACRRLCGAGERHHRCRRVHLPA